MTHSHKHRMDVVINEIKFPGSQSQPETTEPSSQTKPQSAQLGLQSKPQSAQSGLQSKPQSAQFSSQSKPQSSQGAPPSPISAGSSTTDENASDFLFPRPSKKPVSAPKPKPKTPAPATGMANKGSLMKSAVRATKIGEGEIYSLHSGPTGAADEAWFLLAFHDVPVVVVNNHRELEVLMKKISDDLKSATELWERKVDALRKIRSMVIHLNNCDEEILAFIKNMAIYLMTCLKDLRSQVVRESCLTFAFLCKELKNRVDTHTCEIMMIQLMTNMMSSAKVIVSASQVAMRFMFNHVTHSRLITELVKTMQYTKAQEVRTATCELLDLIMQKWPVHRLEQQLPTLQKGIKMGMTTGSSDGRLLARRAYWAFRSHFPEQGEALLQGMDQLVRKHLQMEQPKNMAAAVEPVEVKRPRAGSGPQQVNRANSAGSAVSAAAAETPSTRRYGGTCLPSVRSNSAIDLHAVQRAKARQQYAALDRQKAGCVSSLPRPVKKTDSGTSMMSGNFGAERTGRTRSRVSGVSHSQPSSRSGSPSSRLGYHTYNLPESTALGYQSPSRRSTPRSQGPSRETSPSRFSNSKNSINNLFANKRRPPIQPVARPVLAQKMLAESLEAETFEIYSDLNDAENADYTGHKVSPRKTSYRPFEDHSDDSDASSLCSERSFDSYRRTSDDIVEIIVNCESIHWGDRKEGLVALQSWLQAGNTLNPTELKKVIEIFTKMFMDSHTKVFSLFLDTLNELLLVHRSDLNSWLYVLLTRLLNKMGTDLLGSIQSKILKSLDVIRDSFPTELQMAAVLRFLTDPTQTPNLRVKIAALNFTTKLAAVTDPSQAFPPLSPGATRDPVQSALHKIIGWTMGDSIKQGTELRRASQEAILALFNLSTPQVTLRLANLPQEYQEAAATLLRCRVRRSSSGSTGGITSSPPSPSPRVGSPALQRHARPHDSDNPEDIYKSLRKTTAEIQNYTYETGSEKPPDKDNTTSKDSGISQLSGIEALEEAMEELSFQSSSSNATNTLNSVSTVRDCNGVDTTDDQNHHEIVSVSSDGDFLEQEAMLKAIELLRSPSDSDGGESTANLTEAEILLTLNQLTKLIKECSITTLQYHFKALLRILLGNLGPDGHKDVQTRIMVLSALSEMIKKRAMTEPLKHYIELLILKVLNSYKDSSKEVVKHAESCANTIATNLDPTMVIRVLVPLIRTGEYPLNLAAIKMLKKLVEFHGRDPAFEFLDDLMTALVHAYDNHESSVRKASVFTMVALYLAIGDEGMKTHMAALTGSKLKLLQLYIIRNRPDAPPPSPPS